MRRGGTVSGAVSLVMIFCVLALAVFTALTLVTADRERTLSDLTAQRAAEYYEADRRAVEITAALRTGRNPDADVTYLETEDGRTAEFSVPAGGEERLEVRLLLRDGGVEILRWRTVYGGEWQTDETIEVWDGMS